MATKNKIGIVLAALAMVACGPPEGAGNHEHYATGELDVSVEVPGSGFLNSTREGVTIGFTVSADGNEIEVTFDGCDVAAPYLRTDDDGSRVFSGGSNVCPDGSELLMGVAVIGDPVVRFGFERHSEDSLEPEAMSFRGTY